MAKAIGIDLGTTNSCVGVWQNDRVEIIANDQGNRTTPSCVSFSDTQRLIGDAAKNQDAMNPINTIFDAKRLIGRKFEDAEVQSDLKHFPFGVGNKDTKPYLPRCSWQPEGTRHSWRHINSASLRSYSRSVRPLQNRTTKPWKLAGQTW
ncbi:heat shock cognate 70-kd protein [Flagelloscypha sp. PMI_526]|nr:heat shock cognate 70-kd protein [Flagelloscypha sp. PMI_526]